MELRQLEHFLAIVEEGSFTAAAGRLYMVQSSLSASLLGLERELGAELFIRGRRGAELTDAGQALIDPARAALAETDRARDAVAEVKGLVRGTVRIACVPVPKRADVIETIQEFREQHPGVHVHVLHDGARDLPGLVADGQFDLAVTPLMHRSGPAVRFELLVATPLVLLCPKGHRLAGAHDVDVRDVVDEPIVDVPREWWMRSLFDGMCEARNLRREVRLEVNEWFGVLTMVRRGMGVSYGPRACLDDSGLEDIRIATFADAPMWELGIVTRGEGLRGAAGRAFLEAYRRRFRERVA